MNSGKTHFLLILLMACGFLLRAEVTQAQTSEAAKGSTADSSQAPAANGEKSDASLQDPGMAIKVNVNLVQMRVVVRDSAGKPVRNLKREDFQIYDRGKLQSISSFHVETPETRREKGEAGGNSPPVAAAPGSNHTVVLPNRFLVLVFDDTHLSIKDVLNVRNAAARFLATVEPTDRVGLYSTSGQLTQEFTSDAEALRRAAATVTPRPLAVTNDRDCPNVTPSMADRIENQADSHAMDIVTMQTLLCAFGGDHRKMVFAQTMAQAAVHQALRVGEAEAGLTFRRLEDALRRLAAMPGERIMVLISPGFVLSRLLLDERGMVEQANRANIVINTLDVRGLYIPDSGEDISKRTTDTLETGDYESLDRADTQRVQSAVLADFAYGTGGTFFHNSNDLHGGLKTAATSPEICYVLGFASKNLKLDGKYHNLDVVLAGKQKYSVQARRGYYAPVKMTPEEQATQEIAEAVYSREEMGNLFLELQAHALNQNQATQLNVVSQVAVKSIHFRKANGKNSDILRMVTAIFDENGNFVTGREKVLTMKLDDSDYEKLSRTGLTVNLSFDIKPGRYLVRQLLRDSEDGQIAARNRAVEVAN